MQKKRFWLILSALFLINIALAFAANPFTTFFDGIRDFNLINLYENYDFVIESLLYSIIFIGFGVNIATKSTQFNNRSGKTVFVTLGIALGISAMSGLRAIGVTLKSIGPTVAVIGLLVAFFYLYKMFKSLAGQTDNKAFAFFLGSIGLLLAYSVVNNASQGAVGKFLESNSYTSWLPSMILGFTPIVALIAGIIALTNGFGRVSGRTPSGTTDASTGGNTSDVGGNTSDNNADGNRESNRTGAAATEPQPERRPSDDTLAAVNNSATAVEEFISTVNNFAGRALNQTEFNNLINLANQANNHLRSATMRTDLKLLNGQERNSLSNLLTQYANAYDQMTQLEVA